MNEPDAVPIRPRTDEERKAFVSGYLTATGDAANRGVEFAQTTAKLLAEMELELEGS